MSPRKPASDHPALVPLRKAAERHQETVRAQIMARARLADAVRDAIAAGAPVLQVADVAGITRATAYSWSNRED